MITINFKATNLTQIDNQFKNPDLIRKDAKPDKGWLLNTGIAVAENGNLYINFSDTSWLKVIGDEELRIRFMCLEVWRLIQREFAHGILI
jgi:mannuronan 5-epimerase